MSKRIGPLGHTAAAVATVLAATAFTLVPSGVASAATPLCTTTINVNRGGNNLAVPATGSGNVTCLIGRTQAANSAVVRSLQYTLKACYPTVHLAAPYASELVGNLAVDGGFGPRTEAALKGVQGSIGTTADGVYGPNTRNAMRFPSNDVANRCYHY
ncbi:peptidoglycan-binding domain-containing protein [Amycolatopsis sp. NPDC004747]